MRLPGPIISANWLKEHLDDPDVVVIDATVHLPDTGRDAKAEYEVEHIPGAVFFDLEVIADPNNPRPRKIPPLELFVREIGKLGIDAGKRVVAYDTLGLYSAARVWWLFLQYGYDNVSVLDGGMVAWRLQGGATECGVVKRAATGFTPGPPQNLLALWTDVLEVSKSGGQIVDARTRGRWAGTEIDRYPGTRAGHIPGSTNLYWADLLDPKTRCFLPQDVVREKFERAGLRLDEPVTISCGSGLTACILAIALRNIGKDDWRVYDGSWDEWGRNHNLPVEMEAQ
ncbi:MULTISPECIES: sulfurtransferase [unclassified Burkholderia]|uniref:sulfurtransferase n=1 Tax=unclassified Burkholderia TaxID=2613784 RepID=UPI002AB021EB|nr:MULTISPECIES: sulfurtransferase [unclassified Burkholderia]